MNLAANKRAKIDYEILETKEAGLVLAGYEVKSVKAGQLSLRGAFVTTKDHKDPELFLARCYIAPYKQADVSGYQPERLRKLLLHKREIKYLALKKSTEGLTLIPLRVYIKKGLIKVEIALARGLKKHDKRTVIKKRETDQRIRRAKKV